MITNYTDLLFKNQNEKIKNFSEKLTPDTKYPIIGVRVPILRDIAKKAAKANDLSFLKVKHEYFEEYFLHGLIIGYLKKDFNETKLLLDDFIPHIDNWAICDSVCSSIKTFDKFKTESFEYVKSLLTSDKIYTIRFAIVSLLFHFVNTGRDEEIVSLTKNIISEEYYINMALSWLYCELLIKNYDEIIPLLQSKTLPTFVQNTTIKKARESFRISQEKKDYLKTLKTDLSKDVKKHR